MAKSSEPLSFLQAIDPTDALVRLVSAPGKGLTLRIWRTPSGR